MLTNFTVLKNKAAAEQNKSYPTDKAKCGVALLSKGGKIYTGHSVCFHDGTFLDAIDMAIYHALENGENKFLAGAVQGDAAPSKSALVRLYGFSDLMLSINIGAVSNDTTLKKLLTELGEIK